MMDRRSFARYLALTAAAGAIDKLPGQSIPRTLKSLVRPGVRIGAQATWFDLQNPRLAAFIAENFNTLTAGEELKWSSFLRPTPTTYNFSRADAMVDFALRHGMRFHGHNLCWNHWLPPWVYSVLTRDNAAWYLKDHIRTVMGRYKGKVDSWDVVNEPLGTWRTTQTGQSPRPWIDLIGKEYIDIAFHTAAETDPQALRVLNFDGLEQANNGDQGRQQALGLLEELLGRNVPIQAIGLESHLNAWTAVQNDSQDRFVRSVRLLGLKILITELDVNDAKISGSAAQCDQVISHTYSEYLRCMVPQTGTEQVIFWTPWDCSDWLDGLHGGNFDRFDGQSHRAGLIDANMELKLAFYAVADALRVTLG